MATGDGETTFEKQGFCGPVTALCWVPGADVLLTGRGTDVLAARVAGSQQRQLGVMRLFVNGRVHGIKGRVPAADPARLLIAAHAEKNVTLAELAVCSAGARDAGAMAPAARVIARLWGLDDWVLDLQLLRGPGRQLAGEVEAEGETTSAGTEEWGFLAVGFAHNTVEIWNWQRQMRVRRVNCSERPVLFTMAMYGEDGDSLVVAAGGFTREVVCWQVLGPKSGEPVQRLQGHTGVVHCVRWRPDGRALVSGSEDRSVRVWLAQEGSGSAGADGTAFPVLVHADSLWGHAARIWECQITDELVATVSEDSSGRVYRYSQDELYARLQTGGPSALTGEAASEQGAPGGGQCISVLKGHQGKHVWKCVICRLGAGGSVVATGGNDAATKIWSAAAARNDGKVADGMDGAAEQQVTGSEVEMPVTLDSYDVPFYPDDESTPVGGASDAAAAAAGASAEVDQVEVEQVVGVEQVGRAGGKKGPREEFVRCCALLSGGCKVVCGTNQGRAVLLVRSTGAWSCLYKNSACQFTTVGVDEDLGMVVLGDARGGLSLVSLTASFAAYTMPAHTGHVMDVFFRRDACTGAAVVYSGDNAETPAGRLACSPCACLCGCCLGCRLHALV